MSNNNDNNNNKNIKLYQSDAIKQSGLINYGFYNIDSGIITIFYNHAINSEIKFTADRKKWTNNHKLLLDELEQYGVRDSETQLLSKKFLNDNETKILADYSNVSKNSNKEDPESEEEKDRKIKEIIVYKYSQFGKGQLHEAVLVNRSPFFINYDYDAQKPELIEKIDEYYRVLRPPNEEEYPYRPYEFESFEELDFYIQKAKQITLDELYKISKNIFRMFVDQDKHIIILLAADSIWTYFQDQFPITHYFEAVGTNDVGKSSIGYTFGITGYRVIKATSISGANYYRILGNVEPGQCVIIEDEGDSISEDALKVSILKTGYEYDSNIPKTNMNTANEDIRWFLPFCYKMILAEKSLKEYKVPGLVDRTFSNPCRPGNVKYSIKEVVSRNINKNSRLQRLYDQLLSFRKLMLCYRLIHYKDQLVEIETGLKNRDNELCKPLLQLFYGTEALEEIKETLETYVKKRRSRKKASLEATLYPIIKKFVFKQVGLDSERDTYTDIKVKKNKTLVKVPFWEVWDYIKEGGIDGHYDEKKNKYAYETIDFGNLYLNSLPTFIHNKFTADVKKQNYGKALLFDIEKLERFEDLYSDSQLQEDNVKIEVKECYVSEEKGDNYDNYDNFLGAYGDISEKKFSKIGDNQGEK